MQDQPNMPPPERARLEFTCPHCKKPLVFPKADDDLLSARYEVDRQLTQYASKLKHAHLALTEWYAQKELELTDRAAQIEAIRVSYTTGLDELFSKHLTRSETICPWIDPRDQSRCDTMVRVRISGRGNVYLTNEDGSAHRHP